MGRIFVFLVAYFTLSFAKANIISNCNVRDERTCMICNCFFETRGESLRGKHAVADVVMLRVRMREFPNSVCGVVHQNNQFSWTREGRSRPVTDSDGGRECRDAVDRLLEPAPADWVSYSFQVSRSCPSWMNARPYGPCRHDLRIPSPTDPRGGHSFFSNQLTRSDRYRRQQGLPARSNR